MNFNEILNGSNKKTKAKLPKKIPHICNGTRRYANPMRKNLSLRMPNFIGKGQPNPVDRITKPQRKILKSKSIKKKFRDSDKDGVINALDCQPYNRKRHGSYYRGIDDFELKSLKTTGRLKARTHKKDRPKRIYLSKSEPFAKRYGDNMVKVNIDDDIVKRDKGQTKVVYIEQDITADKVTGLKEDISGDGFEVE